MNIFFISQNLLSQSVKISEKSEKYNFEGASARHTLKIPLYKKIDQSQVPTIQKAIDSMEKNIFWFNSIQNFVGKFNKF